MEEMWFVECLPVGHCADIFPKTSMWLAFEPHPMSSNWWALSSASDYSEHTLSLIRGFYSDLSPTLL